MANPIHPPALPASRKPVSESSRTATQTAPRADSVDRTAYPFADRYLDLPAGRMHYLDEGGVGIPGGDILLFVHGTPTWSFEWRHLVRSFSAEYRCVALDHLGFGLSAKPAGFAYTPEAHADNLVAFARALDLRNITLVMHDFGGPIGLPLFLREPERVKRIVVLNSWMWSFAGDKAMERSGRMAGSQLGRFLYRRANFSLRILAPYAYGDKKKLTPAIHRQYLDRFPDPGSRELVLWALARSLLGAEKFFASLWDQRASLRALPVLIVWGMRDRAFPPYMLERWKTVLPGAVIAALPAAGHWPHEEEPAAVEKALRSFMESGG